MDKKNAIKLAKNYIIYLQKQKNIVIKKAYLFGSFTTNSFNKESDIDIAIITNNIKDIFDFQILLLNFRRNFELNIEPHVFKENNFNNQNSLANEILNNGLKLL